MQLTSLLSGFDLLALPGMSVERLAQHIPNLAQISPYIRDRVDIEGQYATHIRRQSQTVANFARDEAITLDPDLDYFSIGGMSTEMQERLSRAKPTTFVSTIALSEENVDLMMQPQGAAQRVDGTTPGGLLSLYKHIKLAGRRRPYADVPDVHTARQDSVAI